MGSSVFFNSIETYPSGVKGYEPTGIHRLNIQSLQDSPGTTGQFILGTGRIDNDIYFYFMTGDSITGYNINKLNSTDVKILYSDSARIDKVILSPIPKSWFARYFLYLPVIVEKTETRLYIPKGTIKKGYNIDLQ